MAGKLTRIRVQSCGNGDECPALDQRAEGGIEVTGYPVDRPGVPDGEAVVLVPDTLIPEVASLAVPALGTYIAERHRTDLLRVQTLDYYNVTSDGDDFGRYLAGEAEPTAPGKRQWLGKLSDDAAAGKHRRNVHIVTAPLSDYLRYQFEWCYAFNGGAGQDIRILDVAETPAVAHLLHIGDFNLIEHQHVVRSRYDNDGTYLGAVQVSADAAESYAALAELAWELATPFTTWWDSHPQYHRATRAA